MFVKSGPSLPNVCFSSKRVFDHWSYLLRGDGRVVQKELEVVTRVKAGLGSAHFERPRIEDESGNSLFWGPD